MTFNTVVYDNFGSFCWQFVNIQKLLKPAIKIKKVALTNGS